jgi:ketosteroid isomerase-like protein
VAQARFAGADPTSSVIATARRDTSAVAQTGNVTLAVLVIEAVARGDLDGLLELADPAIEWQSFFALHGSAYHGHDGLRRYMADVQDAFEDIHPHTDDLVGVGPLVIGVGSVRYRGRASGVETEEAAGWVFKFRDGRLTLFRAFSDPVRALEAVGRKDGGLA